MKVMIEASIQSTLEQDELEDKVDCLLDHGTVRDSFEAAELDLNSIQVVSQRGALAELRALYERAMAGASSAGVHHADGEGALHSIIVPLDIIKGILRIA